MCSADRAGWLSCRMHGVAVKPGSSSDKLVQTGDDSLMLIGGTAVAAAALAGAGIALKRRHSNA